MGLLNYRQTRAVYLLIEVEGEDIGHAADEINDGHDARLLTRQRSCLE